MSRGCHVPRENPRDRGVAGEHIFGHQGGDLEQGQKRLGQLTNSELCNDTVS